MENNEKLDWKPEVGKTAWAVNRRSLAVVECVINAIYGTDPYVVADVSSRTRGGSWLDKAMVVYPTPEAALAANPLKVYDLDGKEVMIPRAQDKIIIEMCDRAAEQIANLSEWDDADYAQLGMAPIINAFKEIIAVRDRTAIKMVAKLVYEMNLPENPEGEARLKAAQERFKSAIGGESDQREWGC